MPPEPSRARSGRTPRHALIWTADEDSVDLARAEIAAQVRLESEYALAPGIWLAITDQPFAEIAARLAAAPPIFVRHIAPVDIALPLADSPDDPAWLADLLAQQPAHLVARVEPEQPFSVQTRILYEAAFKPFDINQALSALLTATGAPLDVRAPVQIVSIACTGVPDGFISDARRMGIVPPSDHDQRSSRYALVGLSRAAENLSNWAGGQRRFAREEGQISRAEFKLLEALELFSLTLPARGTALDLGASPGGWTRVLRRLGQFVTAVDPGELDPRLADDKGVRHKRMTAQEFLREEPEQFDCILNDMRMDAQDSARLMVAYAPWLYRHGFAVMTLKLPEGSGRERLDVALQTLQQAYTIAGARQLFHNRSEITVALRPRLR